MCRLLWRLYCCTFVHRRYQTACNRLWQNQHFCCSPETPTKAISLSNMVSLSPLGKNTSQKKTACAFTVSKPDESNKPPQPGDEATNLRLNNQCFTHHVNYLWNCCRAPPKLATQTHHLQPSWRIHRLGNTVHPHLRSPLRFLKKTSKDKTGANGLDGMFGGSFLWGPIRSHVFFWKMYPRPHLV